MQAKSLNVSQGVMRMTGCCRGGAPLKAQISLQDLPCVDNNTSPSRLRTAGNSTDIFFVHYWQQPENTWIFTDSIAFQELEEEKQTYNCLAQCHTSENKDWWPTRSSWLNCAKRDNEAVYWNSLGYYKAVAVGSWLYWASRGHSCLYILKRVEIWTRTGRVAEVAREHGWHPPKSLDSDENFKPELTLFCR